MEEYIDIREYLFILRKKMWIIIATGLVFGLISGLVSFFVLTPIYEANTSLIVNKEEKEKTAQMNTTDDLNYVEKLAVTYGQIIKSKSVLETTIKELNLNMTYEDLLSSITVTTVEDTQIIQISVQNKNPQVATKICNEIPQIFTSEVKRIMKASGVEVIDKASVPKSSVKPNKKLNIAIAIILGLMISVFVVFLVEALDTKITEPKDVEEKLGIPVFGVVPKY